MIPLVNVEITRRYPGTCYKAKKKYGVRGVIDLPCKDKALLNNRGGNFAPGTAGSQNNIDIDYYHDCGVEN